MGGGLWQAALESVMGWVGQGCRAEGWLDWPTGEGVDVPLYASEKSSSNVRRSINFHRGAMIIRSPKVFIVSGILAVSLLSGCGAGTEPETSATTTAPVSAPQPSSSSVTADPAREPEQRSSVGLANPASEYCIKMNGTLDIVQGEAGEIGMCHLPDGTVIEEWELFRRDNGQNDLSTSN